jgi:methionyl aminopeptidase
MITLKTAPQIEKMRRAGHLLEQILDHLKAHVAPGVTTKELDHMAERLIREAGAVPSFKGYNGFPASICASPDDAVVHGFPDSKPLKEGQILSVDCGLILEGWQSDSAFTSPVGKVSADVQRLIQVTEECFFLAAKAAVEGNRLGDIGWAVQQHAEKNGYGVIRDLCGHGIGQDMHEDPSVPNYGSPGRGVRLKRGMTLAVEPMIAMGNWPVYVKDDGWTVLTRDHSLCSHSEHTILVTEGECEILTLHKRREAGQ